MIRQDRAEGLEPFCVVGTAGAVNVGAIDDLTAIADIAATEDLWFHVDGAFGATAVLSERVRPSLAGMERADSLAFDFHKWLHVNYSAGCVLIRHGEAHRFSFADRPEYLNGAAAGLAFACHQAGLTVLALPASAWLLGPLGWRREELAARLRSGLACALLFLVVSVLLGHPYYLRYGATSQEAVVGGELAAENVSIGGQPVALGVSLESVRTLSRALFGYDPALVVLGLLGVLPAARRRELRGALLALLGVVFRDLVGLPGAIEILGRILSTAALGLGWLGVSRLAVGRWRRWSRRPRGVRRF